jgi:uncharacterized RDD family membrane protein YckC
VAEVVTGEAVILDVPCARFPSRLAALVLDMTVQVGLMLTLLAIAGAAGVHLNPAGLAAVALTAVVLIIVGYPATFETLSRGRTLGKMALGLRVVSDDGGPERFRQALVRALAAVVEIWLLTGAPALISSLLSARGKRLGDIFAGTFVIQERLPRRQELPGVFAVVPPPLAGWAAVLELSGLRDQTAEDAGSFLRRFRELTPAAAEELGRRIAAEVAAQVTPPPPQGTPPAALLAAVLAVRRQREFERLRARGMVAALGEPVAALGEPVPRPVPQPVPPGWVTGQPQPVPPGRAPAWSPPERGPWQDPQPPTPPAEGGTGLGDEAPPGTDRFVPPA